MWKLVVVILFTLSGAESLRGKGVIFLTVALLECLLSLEKGLLLNGSALSVAVFCGNVVPYLLRRNIRLALGFQRLLIS